METTAFGDTLSIGSEITYSGHAQGSQACTNLFGALAKAQGEMPKADLDSTNPHFRSKYASLESVWEAARGVLANNGLAICQIPGYDQGASQGAAKLTTILSHNSGEWISGTASLAMEKPTAHAFASAITYLRRICLIAFCGIAAGEIDDDANAAVLHQVETRHKPTPPVAKANTEHRPAPPVTPAPIEVDHIEPPAPQIPRNAGPSKDRVIARINTIWKEIEELGGDATEIASCGGPMITPEELAKLSVPQLMELGAGMASALKELKKG